MEQTNSKNKTTAIVLCLFLGGLGIHKNYLGEKDKVMKYILFFFLLGISCIFALMDLIELIGMSDSEFDKRYNQTAALSQSAQQSYNFDNIAEELEKLHALKEKGIISEEDFQVRKSKLL